MKLCKKCKTEKPFNEFHISKIKIDGLQAYCKQCKKFYDKEWYNKDKKKHRKTIVKWNKKNLDELRNNLITYLTKNPCVDCGNSDIRVLEFDHISGNKEFEISKCFKRGLTWKRVEIEIKKCEVRCANCHRIKTLKERNVFWKLV